MNKYYNYENIDLWYNDKWEDHISYINGFAQWMGANLPMNREEYRLPKVEDPKSSPYFMAKTQSYDDPEVIKYWADKGIRVTVLAQAGKRWVAMVPEKACQDRSIKLKSLVVFHIEDFSDPYWAMRTIDHYREYNEALAENQDHMIVYLVAEGQDLDRIYLNIMQEAFALYPSDLTKIYLDVSFPVSKGQKLSDMPEFIYLNEAGERTDPDAAIEKFGPLGVPAVNVGNRWGNRDSLTRGLVMNFARNEGTCDKEWLIHSEAGKKLMEGIMLEYKYNTIYDEGLVKYWADMGLKFESHEKNGERWLIFTPMQAFEEPENKLPVVLALQEVYPGNEHLAVTSEAYFHELLEIAAQGECIVLFYVLEDPDSNDLIMDMLDEAIEKYPIDPTRVYATGHSHDGLFARILTYRHPDRIAALATLGNPPGLYASSETGNPVGGTEDSDVERLSKLDMPVITMFGVNENPFPDTEEKFQVWAKQYQRRLAVMDCPMKTVEEIRTAQQSPNKAERMIKVPGDRCETVWLHGFENYVIDVKNNKGQYRFRIVAGDNMPHTTSSAMFTMMWSFVRRFKRDPETHEIIELC